MAVARDGIEALNRIGQLREQDPACAIGHRARLHDAALQRTAVPAAATRGSANRRRAGILVSAVSDLSSRAALLKPYAMLQKPIDPIN